MTYTQEMIDVLKSLRDDGPGLSGSLEVGWALHDAGLVYLKDARVWVITNKGRVFLQGYEAAREDRPHLNYTEPQDCAYTRSASELEVVLEDVSKMTQDDADEIRSKLIHLSVTLRRVWELAYGEAQG